MEIWKDVDEFYQVSNMGRVRRTTWVNGAKPVGRALGYTLQNGYREVTIYDKDHNRRTKLIHQLVMEAFVGPCPVDREINHKDGNKRNNNLDNLEYVTASENILHAHRTGLIKVARGQQAGQAILTNRQVRRIRERHAQGVSMSSIARRLKIGLSTVSDIINRKTWDHI